MKNKVKDQPRKVNKKNSVVEPIPDVDVKHSLLNANSKPICATCKKSMFDGVHDMCLLDFVENVNSRAKSAKKHKKQNIWKPTGHVFTEVGLKWKPTSRTFTIVGNSCPLTRITSANVVPPKKTTSDSVETQKPELKVYSRKPKNVKNVGSSKKAKIVESKNANHSEPNHTWGSNATDIPSSSSLVMTVRFGNDNIARIMGYGDYQLGNVTISRVYYVEGLGHNLFSVGQFCDADLEIAFRKNTCFIRNLEASKTKSWLWHRHLSHLNFGKSNKSSNQPKDKDTNQEKLYLLHMDLCGSMRVASINGKSALYYPTNDNDDLGKLDAKADIGIFAGCVHAKKAFRIYNKRTQKIIETIYVTFNELTTMASEQFSLGPRLHSMTPATSIQEAAAPRAVDLADSLVSTSIDQDAPPSSTPSTQEQEQEQPPNISQGFEESPKTPIFRYDPLNESPHEESPSQGSSSNVRQTHTPFEHLGKCTTDHLIANVISNISRSVSTRKQLQTDTMWCYFDAFQTSVEPKNFKQATTEPSWIDAMQEEIYEFERLQVWELVSCLNKVLLIKLKWIYKVKTDEFGRVLKNKARLVAQGFRQDEGIDFEESFAPDNPSHVYKLKKALYGLKQAPRTWYDMMSSFLILQHFSKGAVDPTLFTRQAGNNLLLVQIYVDDIIFASTNTAMCNEFSNQMTTKFKMSMMGQMSFLLGLQISQSPRGIFINQSKYAFEIVKKYGLHTTDSVNTPLVEKRKLDEDLQGKQIDATLYRSMIGSLMYLTSSRPDLIYAVCLCARYQAKPTEKHLQAVKRIFRYLKGTINMGLWYSKDTGISRASYADANNTGCQDTRRITSGSAQFLGDKLIS
ncbi:retrovirus-related pol polyprotein from transposon TNT 1-94 [Tanacetum coccineum]|uniref:Retrovirus-related pol polyprotein from transposon TNT 1-94 n=1 Tax=Tanacetum coccineum TaxID=301880 RepID=A0ABQ5GME5_9ASTR